MAIYAVGAFFDGTTDVSPQFIQAGIVGIGWSATDAPELHQFMRTLKVGDIVYIKAYPPGSSDIIVKAVGIIVDGKEALNSLVGYGRNVRWVHTQEIRIPKPLEKNNVRSNTMYEEFHPAVQQAILNCL